MDLSLHVRQSEAFLSEATEILYGGAAGGGKSHMMRVAAIAWCAQIPMLQVYIFRRTFPDLRKNHMEGPSSFPALLAELLESGHAKINYSEMTIGFWNGAKIHLCHCQHEHDVETYRGAEIHVLMMDELTHFTEPMYRFLRGRLRLGGLLVPLPMRGRFPRILCGSNPGGIGHNWVRASWVDPAAPMKLWRAGRDEGGMLRQFIPAKLADNPTQDPEYADRLAGLGDPALVRAMLDGDWDIVAGGMFDDVFDATKHVLEPFPIPRGWRVDRSFDWGSSKPFSIGWWAEADGNDVDLGGGRILRFPKGTLIRCSEWYGWSGKANEGCRMLATEIARGVLEREREMARPGGILHGHTVAPGPADSAIYATENGACIADDMARVGCRWTPAMKGPGSRINGWERMRRLLADGKQRPMERPGLLVFATCRHFLRTVPVLPRDSSKSDDIDTDAEDHIADEVRYRISLVKREAGSVAIP
ncbi:terminase family protein [Methylibium sp.]|uniref:terminase large subunit domain-containing protein n=1 Tax=Methylibium sp. TaxID=2067992 RepID=UPI0017FB4639|nr:terminase family protein [Methylibium sp.]MBA3589671.1 terminase [Methylibium sp.]